MPGREVMHVIERRKTGETQVGLVGHLAALDRHRWINEVESIRPRINCHGWNIELGY